MASQLDPYADLRAGFAPRAVPPTPTPTASMTGPSPADHDPYADLRAGFGGKAVAEPEPESLFSKYVTPALGVRLGAPIIGGTLGGAIGTAIAPGPGTAIGATLGAGLFGAGGEYGAEKLEGVENVDPGEVALAGALSAIPAGPFGRAAGAAKSLGAKALLHVGEGATQGALDALGTSLYRKGELPSGEELGSGMVAGGVLGGVLGTGMEALHGRPHVEPVAEDVGTIRPEVGTTENPVLPRVQESSPSTPRGQSPLVDEILGASQQPPQEPAPFAGASPVVPEGQGASQPAETPSGAANAPSAVSPELGAILDGLPPEEAAKLRQQIPQTPKPTYAYRARDKGEQGVPTASHSQASLSEADVRRIAPSRSEGEQEVVRINLAGLKEGTDYKLHDRPGSPAWVQFLRPLDETNVERVGDLTPADRLAADKASPELATAVVNADPLQLAAKTGLSPEQTIKGIEDVRADGLRELQPEAVAVKKAVLDESGEEIDLGMLNAPPSGPQVSASDVDASVPYAIQALSQKYRNQGGKIFQGTEFLGRYAPGTHPAKVELGLDGFPESAKEIAAALKRDKGNPLEMRAKEAMAAQFEAQAQDYAGERADPERGDAFEDGTGDASFDPAMFETDQPIGAPKFSVKRSELKEPIRGKNGSALIGYEWRSVIGERHSDREGGMVRARISDWDNKAQSTGTGRDIVHVFHVRHPDGSVTVEGINSAQNILGIDQPRLRTIAEKARLAQQTKAREMKEYVREGEQQASPSIAEASRAFRLRMGISGDVADQAFDQSVLLGKDGRYYRTSPTHPKAQALQDAGWEVLGTGVVSSQPKFAVKPSPGQRGLMGIGEDVPTKNERPKEQPRQTSMFGGDMLQGVASRTTEGREAEGALFTQEQRAREKAEAEAQGGIKYATRAFHGSPHDFDAFRLDDSTIGTGEGAQAYGHGLYFAGKRAIAEHYKRVLSSRQGGVAPGTANLKFGDRDRVAGIMEEEIASVFGKSNSPRAHNYVGGLYEQLYGVSSRADLQRKLDNLGPLDALIAKDRAANEALRKAQDDGDNNAISREAGLTADYEERMQEIVALRGALRLMDEGLLELPKAGKLYEVDLSPDEGDYLLWDKPLSEQSEKVKAALAQGGVKIVPVGAPEVRNGMASRPPLTFTEGETGRELYQGMSGDRAFAADTSEQLRKLGIPGIKYRDGSSRDIRILSPQESTSGKWTVGPRTGDKAQQRYFDNEQEARAAYDAAVAHNYVIFDDSLVKVKAKYKQGQPDANTATVDNTATVTPDEFLRRAQRNWSHVPGIRREGDALVFGAAPSGKKIIIRHTGEIEFTPQALEAGHGTKLATDVAEGRAQVVGQKYETKAAIIAEAMEPGHTLDHEIVHVLRDHFATERENRAMEKDPEILALAKESGRDVDEELADSIASKIAEYRDGKARRGDSLIHRVAYRIYDFARRLYDTFRPSKEGFARSAVSGEVFKRAKPIPASVEAKYQVQPEQARALPGGTALPKDETFAEAVKNTPGASVTEDGLLMDLVRWQRPEQGGADSIRTGVFYLPPKSPHERFFKNPKAGYGGEAKIEGQTLLRKPLVIKGGAGGNAPAKAYDAIKGKGAYEAMRTDALAALPHYYEQVTHAQKVERVAAVLQKYGGDPDLAGDIVQHSREGNTLPYAIQEHIVAHAVRAAGYDSVLGYSKGKGGHFLSEVFDVRETRYPINGKAPATIHPDFTASKPKFATAPKPSSQPETPNEKGEKPKYATAPAFPIPNAPAGQKNPQQSFTIPEETALKKAQRILQDKLNRVGVYEEAVKAQGGTIKHENLQSQLQSLTSVAGEKIEQSRKEIVDPLVKTLSEHGLSLKDIDQYMYAKHAPAANAHLATLDPNGRMDLSGMSDAKASRIIQDFAKSGKLAGLQKAAQYVKAAREKSLDVMVEGGLLSKTQAAEWKRTMPDYVPLRTFDPLGEGTGTGQGFDIRGKEAKKRLGRTTEADSPVSFMLHQLDRAIVRSEKNLRDQKFADFVKDNNLFEMDKAHERRELGPDGKVRTVRDTLRDADDFSYKVNGETHRIDIKSQDPVLDRVMHNLSSKEMNGFISHAAKFTRLYSQLVTSWNPEFLGTNFARDIQTATANLGTEHGAKITTDMVKNIPAAMKGMWESLGNTSTPSAWARLAKEFREDGGSVGWYSVEKPEDLAKTLQSKIKMNGPGGLAAFQRVMGGAKDIVERANKSVESGTRLAAYAALRDAGVPREKAGNIARNLTIDFTKKGEAGPTVNALYAFANANVQGVARLKSVIVDNPKGRALAAGLAATGFALDQYNHAQAGDKNNDGTNDYDDIPEYVKERNLVFTRGDGKKPILIPLPYGLNVLLTAGRQASQVALGSVKPAKAALNVSASLWSAFNPLGSEADVVQLLAPTALDPIVQHATNRDFTGKPIMPTTFPGAPEKPASEMYFKNVPPLTKEIARLLNEKTGGDKVTPGYISISPETIQHYFDFATGGVGKFASNAAATATSLAKGETPELRTTPFARRFLYEERQSAEGQKYRENVDELETLFGRYKAYYSERNTEKLKTIPVELLKAKRQVDAIDGQIRRMKKALGVRPDLEKQIEALQIRANRIVATARKQAES